MTAFRQMRLKMGLTQEELRKAFNARYNRTYTVAAISQFENGKRTPETSALLDFADFFGVSTDFLLGKKTISESSSTPIDRTILKTVPIIGSIAAGKPILAAENIETYIGLDSSIHADFGLRVRGDSMQTLINDGDICLIRQQEAVENGQIAAVLVDDSATLKRFYKHEDNITLISENPRYSPMVFTRANCASLSVIGLCVGILHTLEK